MPLRLPSTNIRLRSSITIRAIPDTQILDSLTSFGKTSLYGIYAASLQFEPLGQVKDFSRDQTRGFYKRYSLGRYAHEPRQVVPLKIDTKLTIVRAILYQNDLLKTVFGFWGESLIMQQLPFVLIEQKNSPDGDITKSAVLFYNDCWFTSNPIEYDVDSDDQWIIQDREIQVGSITVFDATLNGARAIAGETLAVASEILNTKYENIAKDIII